MDSLRRKAGRPPGTGKYKTGEARLEARRESMRKYKRSERGKLLRKIAKVKRLQVEGDKLLELWIQEQSAANWSEIDARQKQLLDEYLAGRAELAATGKT